MALGASGTCSVDSAAVRAPLPVALLLSPPGGRVGALREGVSELGLLRVNDPAVLSTLTQSQQARDSSINVHSACGHARGMLSQTAWWVCGKAVSALTQSMLQLIVEPTAINAHRSTL